MGDFSSDIGQAQAQFHRRKTTVKKFDVCAL